MTNMHVVIMAGGTGGHVFPALAVARELTGRGASVSWLGTRRGLESRLVPAAGFPIDYISIADAKTLDEQDEVRPPALVSLAVRIGKTRLIDNVVVG